MGEWMLGEGRRERRDESVSINLYKLYGMHCALDDLIALLLWIPCDCFSERPLVLFRKKEISRVRSRDMKADL